ncbi:type II toxin-antitoxin system PemK/MazF family toxin [Mucilaginibacter ginkgonis]|uniref:mRNA interferase n=1 Tax=Mucilaginibacter ginkgonis TaxID=2682091 RepID=A0A6I4HY36_9SPHI|nr:type II toxin-antitoxin system PemK/MazF family toxin [Mucilaginibacter ginkgonis]QQL49485.1 type II toxin-antitoxin system PemK/MazF family toxin [Mucilaginibacter ginkgonis]
MTKIQQFDIWIADLRKADGTELGKTRPVLVLQADLLNHAYHVSTIICGISSQHRQGVTALRIAVKPDDINGLEKDSYIICDQIRSIDNTRLEKRIGRLSDDKIKQVQKTLRAVLNLY